MAHILFIDLAGRRGLGERLSGAPPADDISNSSIDMVRA
jgi:hypothetical protein